MNWTSRMRCAMRAAAVGLAIVGFHANVARAASVSYPNVGPVAPGLTFSNISESSGTDAVPLYNAPAPFSTGLDFTPAAFAASTTGGGIDLTDGQLNFTATSSPGPNPFVIKLITVTEAGTYTLAGTGTATTQAVVGANLRATVKQIDGVSVAPILLAPADASLAFNLVANGGAAKPWSLITALDVDAQLTSLGVPFIHGATQVDVVIDNALIAFSEALSTALVRKTDFEVEFTVPEPGTCVLAVMALGSLSLSRARRQRPTLERWRTDCA